jgi:Kef-type K+ transport system membrane component KefB
LSPISDMDHGFDIGSFLLAFACALLGAKLLGNLVERIGQPAVLGELLAGVLLGPSVLGLVPLSSGLLLVAEIGIILLLFEVGLETDLDELIRVGPPALAVAVAGMLLPFLGGFFLTLALGFPSLTAIFVGAALTATSIGITARVLSELQALNTREGQIILGAAVADDVLGLVVLAVVSRVAATGTVSATEILRATGLSFGFLLLALALGIPIGARLIRFVEKGSVRGFLVAASVAFACLVALAAKKAGSAEIVGAFAAGLVLARTNRRHDIENALHPTVDIFAPIFFVTVGAQVDVAVFNPLVAENRAALLLGLGLTLVGLLGKFAAGYCAWGRVRKAFIGAGMIPRGEVGLIFAQIGKATGALPPRVFAAVIIAVFATTFAAPFLLKAFRPDTDEAPRKPPRETRRPAARPAD